MTRKCHAGCFISGVDKGVPFSEKEQGERHHLALSPNVWWYQHEPDELSRRLACMRDRDLGFWWLLCLTSELRWRWIRSPPILCFAVIPQIKKCSRTPRQILGIKKRILFINPAYWQALSWNLPISTMWCDRLLKHDTRMSRWLLNAQLTTEQTTSREWVSRYGAPDQMHSDRGPNFEGRPFHEVCETSGVKKIQRYGQAERTNRFMLSLCYGSSQTLLLGRNITQAYNGLSMYCKWIFRAVTSSPDARPRTSTQQWRLQVTHSPHRRCCFNTAS